MAAGLGHSIAFDEGRFPSVVTVQDGDDVSVGKMVNLRFGSVDGVESELKLNGQVASADRLAKRK